VGEVAEGYFDSAVVGLWRKILSPDQSGEKVVSEIGRVTDEWEIGGSVK
jgi:hypothetical protein